MTVRWKDAIALCPDIFGRNNDRRCVGCGAALQGRCTVWCRGTCQTVFWENHQWGSARQAALVRDRYRCTRCGGSRRMGLEVNHIEPILGRHGQNGCHHHLEGIETLCHACHVTETNRQFGRKPKAA